MQEDTIGWDSPYFPPHYSLFVRLYVLFLLFAILVTIAKLITLWIAAPPFRLSRQTDNPAYLKQLKQARNSLKQWMGWDVLFSAGGSS